MISAFIHPKYSTNRRMQVAALLSTMFIALGVVFAVAQAMAWSPPLTFGAIIILVTAVFGLLAWSVARSAPLKSKRVMVETDMYLLIDRLVHELDDDELAYLQSQLEARKGVLKNDLALSLDDALEYRRPTSNKRK